MPIYEYLCEKCSFEFERQQRITEDPIKTCPKCRSRRVKKLISQTSFVLKGSGWYSDLYSSPKKDDKKSSDSGESSGDGDSSASKSGKDSDSSGSTSSSGDGSQSSGSKKDGKKRKGGKKNAA